VIDLRAARASSRGAMGVWRKGGESWDFCQILMTFVLHPMDRAGWLFRFNGLRVFSLWRMPEGTNGCSSEGSIAHLISEAFS